MADSPVSVPVFLKLASHEVRWQLLSVLSHSDYRVQELVRLVEQPQNLVSYHLRLLREQQVVTERRSSADERSLYYSLNVGTVRSLYQQAGEALHPALRLFPGQQQAGDVLSFARPPRLLFLCTENSARSQMAEALLRHLSQGRVEAQSAGSAPSSVHPLALRVLGERGIATAGLFAKHLDTLTDRSFDEVITVCDRVREICPSFPGNPESIHWSLADPAHVDGDDGTRYRAFERVAEDLTTRLGFLLSVLSQHDWR